LPEETGLIIQDNQAEIVGKKEAYILKDNKRKKLNIGDKINLK